MKLFRLRSNGVRYGYLAGMLLAITILLRPTVRAGEFIVTVDTQYNGTFTYHGDPSDPSDDLDMKDQLAVTMHLVKHYDVLDQGTSFGSSGEGSYDDNSCSVSGKGHYNDHTNPPQNWGYKKTDDGTVGGGVWVDLAVPSAGCSVGFDTPNLSATGESDKCADFEPWMFPKEWTFNVPAARKTWSFTQSWSTNYINYMGCVEVASCTVTVQFVPTNAPKWEAVISFLSDPGLPDYETWLPIGGPDEDHPGTNLMALVQIRPAAGNTNSPPKASYTISLEDVSSEPGVCLNSPPKDKAKSSKDLQIYQLELGNLKVSEDGQSATSKQNATSVGLIIDCYDFGAYGKLKATAKTEDGQTLVAYLDGHPDQTLVPIPKDDNGNHVADAWEKDKGVYDRNLAADWDEVDYPKDHKCAGDGISLYERYRGFKFQGLYERLTPTNKFVFVYDPDDLVKDLEQNQDAKINCFRVVSGCRVRYVEDEEWTGQGMAGAKKRIVNFNSSGFGHAVDQHGITVTQNLEETPVVPPDWDKMWQTHNNGVSWSATDSLQDTLGITWPDYTTSGFDCPKNTFLITIYPPRNTTDIRDWVGYHTWALPAYANYAHLPPADQAAMVAAVAAAADAFISDVANYEDYQQRYYQNLSMTTTHEMGHGLGVKHHDPTDAGSHQCVMRYFGLDCPRNANDRFELAARAPWPNIYCRSADHTANARGCWYQIKITDK